MKVRIKQSTSIRLMPVFAMALLATFGAALAETGRDPVTITGQVDLSTFSGDATATIGTDTLSGTVQVIPMATPEPKDGGLYFPVINHVFTFEGGSTLTTTGAELAMPTDENPAILTLHGNMDIIDGTGVLEGASGELRVNGQMDFSIGQATFESKGAISR
jgi:hypothetical protein